ncbi:hypothetical protein [Arthrospiribacter ruber]|uniref:GWxTD domain-containing protein n=1 Tax=Arthrospiribacter ruber TaxID=2487934 RepID=A0A951ITI9_9BACT|nr:hypothetical protein [Arthrospiribacter ruber]MBW3467145.1 hypothetical protein [Arthrospiribacter ruber]
MKKLIVLILHLFICLSSAAQVLPEEKVFAHLSKKILVTGENLHFSVMARSENAPSPSAMAYAELIDRTNQPVAQVIIPLEQGFAENQLEIPSHLPSDHYLFRVYTRISPYLGEQGIFNQFITVIHPSLPPDTSQPVRNMQLETRQSRKKIDLDLTTTPTSGTFNIPFGLGPKLSKSSLSISLKNPYLSEELQGYFYNEVYQKISQPARLIPEPLGHIVHARTPMHQSDTSETFFLSSHGTQSILNSAKPSPQGELFFDLGALRDFNFLLVQSANQEKQLDFNPQSPFLNIPFHTEFGFPQLSLEEKDREFLQKLLLAGRSENYYMESEKQAFLPIATGFVADKTYLLDDYNRFENMEVTWKEYIPEVLVRRQSRKLVLRVLDKPLSAVFRENPLVLIDAMPVFEIDRLGKFDPQNFEKIEILAREFFLNQDRFAGVISITSFENDFGGFELPENSLYLNYWPVQATKKFISPHLVKLPVPPNFPDFRSLLYWNADVEGQMEQQFQSSMTPGVYEIVISGIMENGDFEIHVDEFRVEED